MIGRLSSHLGPGLFAGAFRANENWRTIFPTKSRWVCEHQPRDVVTIFVAPRFTGTPSDPPFQEDPKAVEKALKASEQEMGLVLGITTLDKLTWWWQAGTSPKFYINRKIYIFVHGLVFHCQMLSFFRGCVICPFEHDQLIRFNDGFMGLWWGWIDIQISNPRVFSTNAWNRKNLKKWRISQREKRNR